MSILGKRKHLSEEQISAYVDNTLSERQRQAVETHLRHCSLCANKVAATRRTKQLLAALPAPPLPRAFTLTQADIASARRTDRGHWLRPLWNAATVMTALLLLFLIGQNLIMPFSGTVAPMAARQVEMTGAKSAAPTAMPTRSAHETAADTETPLLLRAPVGNNSVPQANSTVTVSPPSRLLKAAPENSALSEKAVTSAQPATTRHNPLGGFLASAVWPKVVLALLLALLLASRPLLPQ